MKSSLSLSVSLLLAPLLIIAGTQTSKESPAVYVLDSIAGLEVINTKADAVTYRGRKAVHLVDRPGQAKDSIAGGNTVAVLQDTDFKDGTIEVDVAGAPRAGASEGARGFVGVAFHLQEDRARFECFYLRPTNGRADDQLRRNHATQYIAEPDFPWQRLRSESPGLYESYVDLEPGAWTHLKIEVAGAKARLSVNAAAQPALIVNDMKHTPAHGPIALWIGLDTEAYFSRLTVQ